MLTEFEPRHDKTNNVAVRPAKTLISLGIRPVWSESLLCAKWVAKGARFFLAHSEDSDQTGRMPRLIWVFAGCTVTFYASSSASKGATSTIFNAYVWCGKNRPSLTDSGCSTTWAIGAVTTRKCFVCLFVWFVVLRPSQQLWSCQDGQLTQPHCSWAGFLSR